MKNVPKMREAATSGPPAQKTEVKREREDYYSLEISSNRKG